MECTKAGHVLQAQLFNLEACDPASQSCQSETKKDNFITVALTAALLAMPSALRWAFQMGGGQLSAMSATSVLLFGAKQNFSIGTQTELPNGRPELVIRALNGMVQAAQMFEAKGDIISAAETYKDISRWFEGPFLKNRDGAGIVAECFLGLSSRLYATLNKAGKTDADNSSRTSGRVIVPTENFSSDPLVSAGWVAYAKTFPLEREQLPSTYQVVSRIISSPSVPEESSNSYVTDVILKCIEWEEFGEALRFSALLKNPKHEVGRIQNKLERHEFSPSGDNGGSLPKIYEVARLALFVAENLPEQARQFKSGVFLYEMAASLKQSSLQGIMAELVLLKEAQKRFDGTTEYFGDKPFGQYYYLGKIADAIARREKIVAAHLVDPKNAAMIKEAGEQLLNPELGVQNGGGAVRGKSSKRVRTIVPTNAGALKNGSEAGVVEADGAAIKTAKEVKGEGVRGGWAERFKKWVRRK